MVEIGILSIPVTEGKLKIDFINNGCVKKQGSDMIAAFLFNPDFAVDGYCKFWVNRQE